MIKKIVLVLIFLLVFSVPVRAESEYERQYDALDITEVTDALDSTTRQFFEETGLDIRDFKWVDKLSEKGFITRFLKFISGGFSDALKAGVYILCAILICSAFGSFSPQNSTVTAALYATVLAVCAFLANDLWEVISFCVAALKSCSSFMLSFVPIFATVTTLSGAPATAVSMSGILLAAAEATSAVASFVILPLLSSHTAFSIGASVSDFAAETGLGDVIKKISVWGLSLISTLFVGVLGIQTAVNSAADSMTLRTARFILGTTVPVAGGALAEAVGSVASSLTLLRSSLGIYSVAALAVIFLPCIVKLLLWRGVLCVTSSVAQMFSLKKVSALLKAADGTLSVLLSLMLIIVATFIISLTMIVAVRQ